MRLAHKKRTACPERVTPPTNRAARTSSRIHLHPAQLRLGLLQHTRKCLSIADARQGTDSILILILIVTLMSISVPFSV